MYLAKRSSALSLRPVFFIRTGKTRLTTATPLPADPIFSFGAGDLFDKGPPVAGDGALPCAFLGGRRGGARRGVLERQQGHDGTAVEAGGIRQVWEALFGVPFCFAACVVCVLLVLCVCARVCVFFCFFVFL